MFLSRNDGKSVKVTKPLEWYQWLFVGSPALIFLLSSAIGVATAIAIVGIFLNLKIFRAELNDPLKYVLSSAVTILLIIGYVAVSILLVLILYGQS